MQTAQYKCSVSSVIPWGRGVLLVGTVVLFVNYYKTEVMMRKKKTGPRA